MRVFGNLKFDMTPAPALLARGRDWRAQVQRPVVLAAATREGEEAPLLAAWAALPAPRPLLLLVPRHPQRFDEVAALIAAQGHTLARRSTWGDTPPGSAAAADVWLGDSMREMPLYYALADVALLGGSFAPLGGQNLIEAAACGCPLLMGPHTFNFAQAAELALAAGAALRVDRPRRPACSRPRRWRSRLQAPPNAARWPSGRWPSPRSTAAPRCAWRARSSRCCRRCEPRRGRRARRQRTSWLWICSASRKRETML